MPIRNVFPLSGCTEIKSANLAKKKNICAPDSLFLRQLLFVMVCKVSSRPGIFSAVCFSFPFQIHNLWFIFLCQQKCLREELFFRLLGECLIFQISVGKSSEHGSGILYCLYFCVRDLRAQQKVNSCVSARGLGFA